MRTASCPDVFIRGYSDGFVAKLSADGSALVYSTFLCGNGDDSPSGIALDAAGNAYVARHHRLERLPDRQPDRRRASAAVPFGQTGFVSKLSADGSHLHLLDVSRRLGQRLPSTAWRVDADGNVYVTGESPTSVDFPTTPGVLQPQRGKRLLPHAVCTDAFVTKIDAPGPRSSYSTYLYGELDDAGIAIAVDGAGNAFVVGTTVSRLLPDRRRVPATSNRGLATPSSPS